MAPPRGGEIYRSCDFYYYFYFYFFFSGSRPVETREPILTHNSSKDAVWRKEVPFGGEKNNFWKFGGVLPEKHPKNGLE